MTRFIARSLWIRVAYLFLLVMALGMPMFAQPEHPAGGEANLILPDLDQAQFLGGIGGRTLLMAGLAVSALGMIFGLIIYHAAEEHAGAQVHAAKFPS